MHLNRSVSQSIPTSINQPSNMEPIIWTVITSDTATFQDFMEFMDNYEDRSWKEIFETIPMGFFKIFMEFAIKNDISIVKIRTMLAYMDYSDYPWLEYRNELKDFYEVLHKQDSFEYAHKDVIMEDLYDYSRFRDISSEEFYDNIIDVIYYVRVFLNKTDSIVKGDSSLINVINDYIPENPRWLEIRDNYLDPFAQFEYEIEAWEAVQPNPHPFLVQQRSPVVVDDDATTVSMTSDYGDVEEWDFNEYMGGSGI